MTGGVAVVGAGMGGLVAALRLQQAGRPVMLFDGAERPGGVVRSLVQRGWLVEAGASILADLPAEVRDLLTGQGLLDGAVPVDPVASRRYLVHHGRLVPVPSSTGELLASPLLSLAGRMRMLKEPFVGRGNLPEEESVAAFARRRFGEEVGARFLEPLVSGTSGADPEQVLVRYTLPVLASQERRAGSILKARLRAARTARQTGEPPSPPPVSWPGGLDELAQRLCGALRGTHHFSTTIVEVTPHPDGVELVDSRDGRHHVAAAVAALPAVALGAVRFPPSVHHRLGTVASMPHASPVVVALGYRRGQVAHPLDGYGLLAPASERRRVLSVQFTSSLFPGRAPPDHVLLTVTVGGARQPAHLLMDDAELVTIAAAEVGELLGASGPPVMSSVMRWPAALPLAIAGHGERLAAAEQVESTERRLALTGAWRSGASLGDVMLGGLHAADRLLVREAGGS